MAHAGLVLGVAAGALTILWVIPWLQYLAPALARAGRLITFSWPLWFLAVLCTGAAILLDRPIRTPRVIWGALCSVALIFQTVTWAPIFLASPEPASTNHLRVASLNVDSGRIDAGALVAAVRTADLDVAVVQDLNFGTYEALREAGWNELFPQHTATPTSSTTITTIFSRGTQTDSQEVVSQGFISVRVEGRSGPWTIVTGHPSDPGQNPVDGQSTVEQWHSDSRQLATFAGMQDLTIPTLIVGDLESTAQQAPMLEYRAAGFKDARRQAGDGWQNTWPDGAWFPPYSGTDQVLTGPGTEATSVTTITLGVHRGLLVDVSKR